MKTIMIAGCTMFVAAQAYAQAAPELAGLAKAVSTAEASLDARAFDAELDRERGGLVYEVSLVKNGRAVHADIDAVTGKLVRQKSQRALPWVEDKDELKAAQTAPRNLTQTIAMVEGATKGKVSDISMERRQGRHYYDVELVGAQDRDVMVDVLTGAITPVIDD